MKRIAFMSAIFISLLSSGAGADQYSDRVKQTLEKSPREVMDSVIQVPGSDLVAVETEGRLVFMTGNKRYALVGKLVDMHNNETLDSMDAVRQARRVNFTKVGLKGEDLAAITIGKGEKEVFIFSDPQCPHCARLTREAMKLSDEYTFRVVLLPFLGKKSAEISVQLVCQDDQKNSADRLAKKDFRGLKNIKPCEQEKFYRNGITAQALNIEAVPYIIAPNGEPLLGKPDDLSEFLERNKS